MSIIQIKLYFTYVEEKMYCLKLGCIVLKDLGFLNDIQVGIKIWFDFALFIIVLSVLF